MQNSKAPNPEELRSEVSEFLKERYGNNVIIPPQPDAVGSEPGDEKKEVPRPSTINFNLKPTELERYLRKYVVSQDEAIEVLATKICT
ncbi:MAG: ATPase, partial [Calditrichaeota bacterium]|nr:ATPase [Calditrichota bacterium]